MSAYEKITCKILALLAQGTVPWRKTWAGNYDNLPRNFITKKPYRGINVMLLWAEAILGGYSTNNWMTTKQAATQGGLLKPGQNPALVVYYGWFKPKPTIKDTDPKSRSVLQYFNVFNLDQFEGIEMPAPQAQIEFDPIVECEGIIARMPKRPKTLRGGPAYDVVQDRVLIPDPVEFESAEEYYHTLFHELIHSTGHESRVDRKLDARIFNGTDYSREELVAEFGACFLSGVTGIEPVVIENSASYVKMWYKKLKEEPHWLVYAGGAAQKAVDYILKQ